ncbi:hypothetical protein PLESTB_001083600 [Pleodorina starrii]|uniref:Phosducin domain-containing protein n=1 Tax=Pleodorina starrii TaxID=330485 RepID=A0A9W6BR73_9CHLO|nr:hypothetical protein PLESTM_001175200 [Pleodorina starrii]GLC56242.1 hypothetical protein PLESTB_001083600 [Pleodorina starrii]GLC69124.1 hypothetical protein PLESTF_000792600 [Pleodorina starrii]
MTEYHTVYKGPEGETTQWEDIHRRLGNLPPKPPVWKPDPYKPEVEAVRDASWVEARDEGELREAADAFEDDRFLEEYRQRRIKELQAAASRPRFGSVELIRGNEFVEKITNAGADVWVVVHLFKDGHAGCGLLQQCLDELAAKYPSTKFVRIVSTDAIPNYPDSNLPTLLLYHDTRCLQHAVGLATFGGTKRITPEQVALVLNSWGPLCLSAAEDEEQAQHAQIKALVTRMVDKKADGEEGEDESSDFDD